MNWYSIFGLVARSITLILLIFYVIPKQVQEVRRPKNEFTTLRWLILIGIVAYACTSLPSIAYQTTRLTEGTQTITLQNIATIAGNVANLLVGITLVMIYRYQGRDDNK